MKKFLRAFAPSVFLASILTHSVAQTNVLPKPSGWCGTQIPTQQWEAELQAVIKQLNNNQQSQKAQAQLYTIPVIIHVIHGGQAVGTYPNLAQGQLASQIRVLNEDFGGIGYNSGNYPATAFTTWANNQVLPAANRDGLGRVAIANCNVQFCMATQDTLGNTLIEPGIDRVNYINKGWTNPASFTNVNTFKSYVDGVIKPGTIWNVSKYLNIWITDVNLGAVGLLGYATFPPLTNLTGLPGSFGTSTTDGFWCYSQAFGSVTYFPGGFYNAGNNRGRTSSHEIGHWVGLRHIWGDGTCATDYCNDTPPASASNFNSPVYPLKVGSCNGNSPNGEMFTNIMDYSDDPIKFMFTTDQATRIQGAMSSSPYRKFLGTHNLCSVEKVSSSALFSVPATVCGTLSALSLTNNSIGTPVPNYTWSCSGGATFSPNVNSNVASVLFPANGIYTITLTAFNGTVSVISKTVNVISPPNLVISSSSQSVCSGDDLILTGTGANFYVWQPGPVSGSTVTYPQPSSLQTYTCLGTGAGNCKVTKTITVDVVDCTGLTKITGQENLFALFPNPAYDKLHIKNNSDTDTETTIELFDATGKIVLTQVSSFKKDRNDVILNISSLSAGIYILKLSSKEGKHQTLKLIKN